MPAICSDEHNQAYMLQCFSPPTRRKSGEVERWVDTSLMKEIRPPRTSGSIVTVPYARPEIGNLLPNGMTMDQIVKRENISRYTYI